MGLGDALDDGQTEADARVVGAGILEPSPLATDIDTSALVGYPAAQRYLGYVGREAAVQALLIPAEAWAGGIASAILIGALAGLMPAVRAARMPPTVALRTA